MSEPETTPAVTPGRQDAGVTVPIAILIPTKNEEINLPFALASVKGWAAQVIVLDSGSTDETERIAREAGADFVFHAWEGYARQKNWGLENTGISQPWVFILDADEVITPELREELTRVATENACAAGALTLSTSTARPGRAIPVATRLRAVGVPDRMNMQCLRNDAVERCVEV